MDLDTVCEFGFGSDFIWVSFIVELFVVQLGFSFLLDGCRFIWLLNDMDGSSSLYDWIFLDFEFDLDTDWIFLGFGFGLDTLKLLFDFCLLLDDMDTL